MPDQTTTEQQPSEAPWTREDWPMTPEQAATVTQWHDHAHTHFHAPSHRYRQHTHLHPHLATHAHGPDWPLVLHLDHDHAWREQS